MAHAQRSVSSLLNKTAAECVNSAAARKMFCHIRPIAATAWDVRNTCKHSGAVLPFPSAPVGRGVDGIDAMA
jgi:hypothetical protein